MGIIQKQKKEIERKEMQIKMLKQSIAGRDRAIALWEAQAKGARAVLEAIVKQHGGRIEVDATLAVADDRDVRAKFEPETEKWIIEAVEKTEYPKRAGAAWRFLKLCSGRIVHNKDFT